MEALEHRDAGDARCRTALAYWLAAGVIGLGLFASVTPSPLYGTYSVLWHFSPLTLTLIYATYAFGVLATLLLAGGVSDDVGRRPVLLVALGGPDGLDRALPVRRLGRLAVRRPRPAGARDRRRPERGQRGAARPAPAPRPGRRRTRRTATRRQPASASACSSRRRSSSSAGRRACCRTSCCSSCSRSPSSAPTGCPSRCASARGFRLTVERPSVPARRPPPLPARRAGGALVLVDRRALLLARPAARRRTSSTRAT